MVQEFGGQVRFAVENYGDSQLAKRFGVKRYPAIFVDDILVATPKDFGFYGKGEGADNGRYAPLKSAESHERFRSDLRKILKLELAGRSAAARAAAPSPVNTQIALMPTLMSTVTSEHLAGRVVLVEFWATWCPPCRGTLGWLGEVKKKHGDKVSVIGVAIESDPDDVKKMLSDLKSPIVPVMGSPEIARAFGDIGAVPTLFVFDGKGETVGVFYGAPPTLHSEAEAAINSALR